MAAKSKGLTDTERLAIDIKHAIEHGSDHIDEIKKLLRQNSAHGLKLNCLRLLKSGDSLLHIAARSSNASEILRYLIVEENGNIELANSDGKTPLHEAALYDRPDAVQVLLEHGANVNALKRADWTPLMLASSNTKSPLVVKLLLEHGADIFFTNKDGWNCFHLACREGIVDIIRVLISHVSTKCSTEQQIKFLFSKSKNGRSSLHSVAMSGQYEACKILLEQAEALEQLNLTNAADNCGCTPVSDACRFGQVEILNLLHAYGGIVSPEVINVNGMNCLHVAAEAGRLEMITHLLNVYKFGIDDANQTNGFTALHYGARENQIDAMALLLKLGADMEKRNHRGQICLEMGLHKNKNLGCEVMSKFNKNKTEKDSDDCDSQQQP